MVNNRIEYNVKLNSLKLYFKLLKPLLTRIIESIILHFNELNKRNETFFKFDICREQLVRKAFPRWRGRERG